MRIVIIGGVAGGATAAARLRRLNEEAEIVIIERSGFVSYANCGLPYYVGGTIVRKESLTLQTPRSLFRRFRIDVRVNHEAVSISCADRIVTVKNLVTGEVYELGYDKLILSPGAKAIRPEIPGMNSDKVFTLRTVEDTYGIERFIAEKKPAKATVIGGGFIGLEMAENLCQKGISVTLLQRSGHVMPTLDYDMACVLHAEIRKKGIALICNANVAGLYERKDKILVEVEGKDTIVSDMVIVSVGVVPESELAKNAGLKLGEKGGIVTDMHMRTSDENIYAVGDAVEVRHYISGTKTVIPLAGPANKQGRIAADNICGIPSVYNGSQGSAIMKFFHITVASTGLNRKTAKAMGMDCDCVILTSASHAAYYPGSNGMYIKVVFSKSSGTILGAQIVGQDGVDKRIDILATAIRSNMNAADLEELELAYAPPFSSAKDPVNMTGFVISNILDGLVKQIQWDEIDSLPEDAVILDTRTNGEFVRGHIEGAIHIPVDDLRERLDELAKEKTIYVYCHSGLRSYLACRILSQSGYDCINIAGGYGFYQNSIMDNENN